MEDTTSWKGHGFTLLVFTGIVVLCAIFFTLGMLVGRAQGQKMASVAAAEAAAKAELRSAPKEERPELTFFDSVEKEKDLPTLEPAPPPPPEVLPGPAISESNEAVVPVRANVINYQIAALKKSSEAERLLETVKQKGFRAFILAPVAGDPNPLFRVQVGPFANSVEADDARNKLEGAGFQPILKK